MSEFGEHLRDVTLETYRDLGRIPPIAWVSISALALILACFIAFQPANLAVFGLVLLIVIAAAALLRRFDS